MFVGLFLLFFALYVVAFWPRTIIFSYSGNNCVSQLSLFPRLLQASGNSSYKLTVTNTVDIAGYPVIGRQVCVTPESAPREGKAKVGLAPFGWLLARKTFTVETPAAPVVSVATLTGSVALADALQVPISAKDIVYSYDLAAGKGSTTCQATDKALACDLSEMQLVQGQQYVFTLERSFNDFRETIGQKELKVLDPVRIEQSSVQSGQTVYDKPSGITIKADKPLKQANAVLERTDGGSVKEEAATVKVTDKQITVTPAAELAREAAYRIRISDAKGMDGSTLAEPYVLPFQVSGGPKVTGVSIGSYGVNPAQAITIQFDQPIKSTQDIGRFVHVNGIAASVTKSGNRAYVRLSSAGTCSAFTITVDKGLMSDYDIVSSSAWQYTSRTRCSTVATIGYSVKSRPIYAYSFGSGANTILFTGAIHGNELSGKYLMDDWIQYLEQHAQSIPADKRIVIIPSVNPDGVAAGTRNNAHDVNLNRNFSTANWSPDIQLSGGGIDEGAGGASPLSEPEAVALAQFTQGLQPRFVVSYHSQGSLVNSNDVGSAATLGPKYAAMTGYAFVASTATGEAFGYEVTGTYEDWLAERSIPAILIELPTNSGRYLSRNLDAMWTIVNS